MKKYLTYLSSILFIYILAFIIYYKINNSLVFPNPNDVIKETFILLGMKKTYLVIFFSFKRLFISLLFSFFIGIILGITAGLNKYVNYFLRPIITIFRTIPLASVILLIMMIFGITKSPFFVISLMIIPVVYEAFYNGIINIDKEINDVWRLDTSLNILVVRRVLLPTIVPFAKTAYIQSIGLGIKVLVMSEFIAQTKNSVGKELVSASNNIMYTTVLAWTIILITIVLIIEIIPKMFSNISKV